ncbi:MAG: hypothetical protein ACTSXJ_11070 [Candidatus Baldrarchaeia archaeon]
MHCTLAIRREGENKGIRIEVNDLKKVAIFTFVSICIDISITFCLWIMFDNEMVLLTLLLMVVFALTDPPLLYVSRRPESTRGFLRSYLYSPRYRRSSGRLVNGWEDSL